MAAIVVESWSNAKGRLDAEKDMVENHVRICRVKTVHPVRVLVRCLPHGVALEDQSPLSCGHPPSIDRESGRAWLDIYFFFGFAAGFFAFTFVGSVVPAAWIRSQ